MARLGCRTLLDWQQSQLSDKNSKHHYTISSSQYSYYTGTKLTFSFTKNYCYIRVGDIHYEWTNKRICIFTDEQDIFSANVEVKNGVFSLRHYDIALPDHKRCMYYTLVGVLQAMSKHRKLRKFIYLIRGTNSVYIRNFV